MGGDTVFFVGNTQFPEKNKTKSFFAAAQIRFLLEKK